MIEDKRSERKWNDYAGWLQFLVVAGLATGAIALWKSEWLGAMGGAFLAAIIGIFTTLFTEHQKDLAKRRGAATLLYFELKEAVRMIKLLRVAWNPDQLPPELRKAGPSVVQNRLLSQNVWPQVRADLVGDLGPEHVKILNQFYEQALVAD